MPELKTQKNNKKVIDFLNSVDDEQKKSDSIKILNIMKEITKLSPNMWGESIIGFGDITYKTADGKKHKWFKIGFSPRKQNISLYILDYSSNNTTEEMLLKKLGKYKRGKSCLYIKTLKDIDISILRELISESFQR